MTGHINGQSHMFRVAAENSVAIGDYTSTIVSATPATVPGAQVSLQADVGNTCVSLSWNAPSGNGGAAIADYVIEYRDDSGTSCNLFPDDTSTLTTANGTDLINGQSYTFRVNATNAKGTGPASNTVQSTPVAPVQITAPGAPTALPCRNCWQHPC